MKIFEIKTRRALAPSKIPGLDYALNPYVGCLHGCLYCYASHYTRGPPAAAWGSIVYVKTNLVETLKRELRKAKPGVVGISTITDPYQPPEARYKITRRSIEALAEAGFKASVQTKSGMVVRDIDLFTRHRDKVDVGVTITTLKDKARILEPAAAHPAARAKALEKLAAAGIKRWIFMGPVVPHFNDREDDIEEVVALAFRVEAELYYDRYRPKPSADARMAKYWRAVSAGAQWWREVKSTIEKKCREYGVECRDAESATLPDGYI